MLRPAWVWLAASAAACLGSGLMGAPKWASLAAFLLSHAPAVSGIILRALGRKRSAAEFEAGLWIAAATLGAAVSGGAASPVNVLFIAAAVRAREAHWPGLARDSAVFSVFGFLAAAFAGWNTPALDLAPLPEAMAAAGMVLLASRFLTPPAAEAPQPEARPPAEWRRVERVWRDRFDRMRTRAIEAERAHAEALARVDGQMRFFAQMTHELRTPLNAILGYAELVQRQPYGALGRKYLDAVAMIEEGGRMLFLIVDDVLDFARIRAGRYDLAPEEIDLGEHVEDAVRFLSATAERRQVEIRLQSAGDAGVEADPRAVRHVALNLLSNALKFSPQGGRIDVELMPDEAGAWLVVRDRGPGMSREDADRILATEFEQAEAGVRKGGSGLGLSVVRMFADLHAGRMLIDSEPGEGARVAVYFPRAQARPKSH